MPVSRTHVAVGATCLSLGALGAVAIAQPGGTTKPAADAPVGAAEVRTVTVTRTLHRVHVERVRRHRRGRRPEVPAGTVQRAPAPAAPAAQAPAAAPVAAPAAAPAPRLETRSSTTGHRGEGRDDDGHRVHERESEREDD
jgi:hypothetical protein